MTEMHQDDNVAAAAAMPAQGAARSGHTGRPEIGRSARRSGKRKPVRSLALKAGVAFILSVGACHAQGTEPPALSLLSAAPRQVVSKTCNTASPALPLAIDWTAWEGTDPGVASDRILADAIRLAEGDRTVTQNRPLARRMLEHVANGTSGTAPDAKIRLATLLLDARSGVVDAPRARKLLAEATMSQRTGAAVTMGRLIHEGRLPDTSMDDAVRYLSIAAGLGDPSAALLLAAIHGKAGTGAPAGEKAHFDALAAINVQTALAAGHCDIAVEVGEYLLELDPVAGLAPAADWFEFAAAAGDTRGMARLARAYQQGEGRPLDIGKARSLWDQAAEAGMIRALVPAARLRLDGGDDTEAASALLERAMQNGDADAYTLAARVHRGDYGGRADFSAMQAVLVDVVSRPDAPPAAIEIMAHAYMTGQGVEIDREKADGLYQRLAERGGMEGEAIYGRYLLDFGIDIAQARRHLETAAAGGSQHAAFDLAEIALCGGADGAEAQMGQVAAKGFPAAYRRLARLAIDRGDWTAGADLLRKASDFGDRLAMVELAALAGDGKAPDAGGADALLQRATAPGPNVVDGRLALVAAYRTGRFGDRMQESAQLLQTIADSQRPDIDVEIARHAIKRDGELDIDAITQRLTRSARAGNGQAMLLLSRLAASGSGARTDAPDWIVEAARTGEPGALAQLVGRDAGLIDGVLASLDRRLLCDVPALVQKARLLRLRGRDEAATAVLDTAGRVAERRGRDLHLLAEAFAARETGMPDDPARAAVLFESSAAAGYSKSTLALAHLFASGRLGDEGGKAIEWYRRAASSGDASARKELLRYAAGQPGAKTSDMALDAMRQVAEEGDVPLMQAYGALLISLGPERFDEGVRFLVEAAGRDDVQAMKTLARLHAAGINGTVSANESTRWTRLAAEKGDPEAMFQYAVALDLGFGVETDRKSAQSWHEKAKKNGFAR